jgi:predicted Zn finger-like uncharacterized protein
MFTQCPDCRNTYSVSKKQLRGKKAQIFCSACNKKFKPVVLLDEKPNALKPSELLTEAKTEYIPKPESNQKPNPKNKSGSKQFSLNIGSVLGKSNTLTPKPAVSDPEPERLPWEVENKSLSINWLVGFIVGLLLLIGQLVYFESAALSQNPSYRPHMEKLCKLLGCHLRDYQNLDEFEVLRGSITPNADNTLTIKAVINNQAPFKQKLPNIKLTLLDYNEHILAQRIFDPKDHLPGSVTHFSIAPDATLSVSLTIAAPKSPIGGYTLDLIY